MNFLKRLVVAVIASAAISYIIANTIPCPFSAMLAFAQGCAWGMWAAKGLVA